MTTPIRDFVLANAAENKVRGHMPGHKGKAFLGIEPLDITEFTGADSLYAPEGIIAQSEENASLLFGSKTIYSTEGSSHCIRAMVWLIIKHAALMGKKPVIAAGRNAHSTFVNAAAVLGAEVRWICPGEDESYLSCKITAEKLEAFLQGEKTVPSAVYITSPDYLGNLTDIAPLASVCEKYGTVLAVDNAHGAYLKFAQGFTHPIDAGAHICCDSAHKTLPVLTGGAYLHISEKAPGIFSEGAKSALALFGTTSPSYLILASLDAANGYIADGFGRKLTELGEKLGAMKSRLAKKGYVFCGDEPAKLTFDAKAYGYSGFALSRQIENRGILCEFYDPDYVVLMLSPENGDGDLERIEAALGEIEKGGESFSPAPSFHSPKTVMEPGRAMLADSETVSVENAEGRILSSARVGCPPAVPIVFCGEQIDRQSIECMKYYGISSCRVVK